MLEAIQVIALLCQVSSGPNMGATVREQAECQSYYVACIKKDNTYNYGDKLADCILKKKKQINRSESK